MSDIIGGIIGGVGSLVGGNAAAKQALTGYNYLQGNAANQQAQTAGTAASQAQQQTQGTEQALLTGGPNSAAAQSAFGNYLNSTGYKFQQQQGMQAITGNAASRGLLGSGGTGKALAQYGQGLAGQSFNNYLGQLGSLNTQQGQTAQTGVGAAGAVGQAGTQGGAGAGQSIGTGIAGAAGSFGGAASAAMTNYFG